MSYRLNYVNRSLCLFALIVASQAAVSAEPPQSLADKRLSIFKGTTPGIVIIDFGATPDATTSAQVAAPVAAQVPPLASAPKRSETASEAQKEAKTEVNKSNTVASQSLSVARFFSSLPPPSGRSLQSARRLDAPDQGIAMPTASTTPQPQAEPAAKR